ncbi:MAG: phenylalanine--tRNA ligase subunit beta [bacterium]|nr:phenylalanine--tRNA ligase subunit beta [bacterium]
MDLRVSYRWLKEYLKTDAKPDEVARLLTLHAHTVDRVEHLRPAWKGVVTAKILEIKKHPNADKLRLTRVTDGKTEHEVVCGAPNIEVGQVVPFAPLGATLRDVKTGGSWTLTAAKIRGVESRGMLCATDELGVGDDHSGIWVLPPGTPLGVALEKVYPADDVIFHVEVTGNRPDCMSVTGMAREAAAVVPKARLTYRNFDMSKYRGLEISKSRNLNSLPLTVKVAEPRLCPRYQAVVIDGVKVGPSPLWLQQRLIAAGNRPINNVVDITNYVRLEYGNPLHVFDYRALAGNAIVVRRAKAGEKLAALDEKTYTMAVTDLVIADAAKPVAIAGVMGGQDSAATVTTKTIVFEVANFDPVAVRKTSRRLALLSDSSLLFEKGLPAQATDAALRRAVELTLQICGGHIGSPVYDVKRPLPRPKTVPFDPAQITRTLGVTVAPAAAKTMLQRLGFFVAGAKAWRVTPPWWRSDVLASHDVVEEVARLYGYHRLPAQLPAGRIPVRQPDTLLQLQSRIRAWLAGQGFTEIQSYSLVSAKLLEQVGLPITTALRVANPLSAEFEYLRPTLSASLLSVVGQNIKRFSHQQLFELANIYRPKAGSLPDEVPMLALAMTDRVDDFSAAKGQVEAMLAQLGVRGLRFIPDAAGADEFWQPRALISAGATAIGRLGPVTPQVLERFGIRQPLILCGLDLSALAALAHPVLEYRQIPAFPASEQDLAVVLDTKVSWQQLQSAIVGIHPLVRQVSFLSTYRDVKLPAGKKSIACRIEFRADDRTLSSGEVDGILGKVKEKLQRQFSATIR